MNAITRLGTLLVMALPICGASLARGEVDGAASNGGRVLEWHFNTEDTSPLRSHGGVHRDQPGPRPPHFPDFEATNTAVLFDGDGAYFSYPDPGDQSPLDFTHGDAITIEAWVDLHAIGQGQNVYIVGKGRTGDKGFAQDNQNWSLRLREHNGQACLSFLFATVPDESEASHWHRWTSETGIRSGDGWRRIAVSYRFGEPQSIRGWIDERSVSGVWDMGGETAEAPIVDNDAVWIGSSMGGSAGSSFRGMLDAVSISRDAPTDEVMAARFRREGKAPPSELPRATLPEYAITPGAVTLSLREGFSTHDRWPLANEMPPPLSDQWNQQHWASAYFALPRMPRRYDSYGVRASWKAPVLIHLAADVTFPAGTVRLLVRNRGLGRLWVDDQVVLETPSHQGSTDGHNPVDPLPQPPLPGHRIVGFGDAETIAEIHFAEPGKHRVVLESFVGGAKYRAETGETLVGWWPEGGDSIELLRAADSSTPRRLLTDSDIEAVNREARASLLVFDDAVRRYLASQHDGYWDERHEYARDVVAPRDAPSVSNQEAAFGDHPVDAFIAVRWQQAASNAGGDKADDDGFQKDILPILREHCFRCHGDDAEGGLQLTAREKILAGGDSGEPALVPNDPDASLIVQRIFATDEHERMPPSGKLSAEQGQKIVQWIKSGAAWSQGANPQQMVVAPVIDDASFLRRVSLDTVGVPPSEEELRAFLASDASDKRAAAIDRLLSHDGYADHWVSFWQDLLAENPNVLKPSLNNTGPFRWYLYEALRDNWAVDRMVTELLMFRGSEREGGSAGFAMAADNDAPLASRAHVAAAALLGINLQCARCHDSPYHSTTQQDLFSLAAMLSRKPVTVPPTSTVSPGFFENKGGRESLIRVTLLPGVPVEPEWRFASTTGVTDGDGVERWLREPGDSRERLTVLLTSPHNTRFAQVIVNHLWKRLIGAGLVEPADDWEGAPASHPELLEWLASELIRSGYDSKHVLRLILTSRLYQRDAVGNNRDAAADERFFASPDRRRLSAEQVVDSLYHAAGQDIDVEQLTFDPESRRPASTMITLGYPRRAWEFATLSNERDRPSLALPRAQAVTDVLEAFGWTGSRQGAIAEREHSPGVLQPGMLANGVMTSWLTRASVDSELANLAVNAPSVQSLIESLYLRFLSRMPTSGEAAAMADLLADGFNDRRLPSEQVQPPSSPEPLGRVSWSNHLKPEANRIQVEMERRARVGDPPDPRLRAEWRESYEDAVWAVVNSPEFVFIP